nr:twitch domain-containing radical SAM protein [Azospirillum sp.]
MARDNGSLCALPWVHLNISPDGDTTLCCQTGIQLRADDGRPLNVQTHTLEAIWHSTAFKDVRRRMLAGERLEHCTACYRNERNGWGSYRQVANRQWLQEPNDSSEIGDIRLSIAELGLEQPEAPRYFDLRIGNLCNLKCVNCRSLYSSQIERDPVQSKWNESYFIRQKHRFAAIDEWYNAPEILEEIKGLSDNVVEIQLAGGEPTLNRILMGWLEWLCAEGKAAGIDVGLVTNLTNVSDRFYALLPHFRRIDVKISLDGYGAVYEYNRFPGKWSAIERNIARLTGLKANYAVTIFPVMNVYNMLTLVDLFEWADRYGFPVSPSLVRSSDHVDCRLLPPAARQEARRRFDSYLARRQEQVGSETPGLVDLARQVDLALAEIEANDFTPQERAAKVRDFMEFTNDIDRHRGTSFRNTCPDTWRFMIEAHGSWHEGTRYLRPVAAT